MHAQDRAFLWAKGLFEALLLGRFGTSRALYARSAAMEAATNPEGLKTSATGFSILIVDDESATRELCRDIALEMGLQVHAASTTDEALAILDQSAIDIVVTDLRVPQLGGLELL